MMINSNRPLLKNCNIARNIAAGHKCDRRSWFGFSLSHLQKIWCFRCWHSSHYINVLPFLFCDSRICWNWVKWQMVAVCNRVFKRLFTFEWDDVCFLYANPVVLLVSDYWARWHSTEYDNCQDNLFPLVNGITKPLCNLVLFVCIRSLFAGT